MVFPYWKFPGNEQVVPGGVDGHAEFGLPAAGILEKIDESIDGYLFILEVLVELIYSFLEAFALAVADAVVFLWTRNVALQWLFVGFEVV